MTDLTPGDVRRWDAAAVFKVFQVATNRAATLGLFGEDLGQTGQLLAEWQGEAGSAFHSSLGRLRTDIDKDGQESTQVAAAVSTASVDVQTCKAMMSQVDETAETLGFTITADWKVNVSETAALLMGPQEAPDSPNRPRRGEDQGARDRPRTGHRDARRRRRWRPRYRRWRWRLLSASQGQR